MKTYNVHINTSYTREGKLFKINESHKSNNRTLANAYASGYAHALSWIVDLQYTGNGWCDINGKKVIWID